MPDRQHPKWRGSTVPIRTRLVPFRGPTTPMTKRRGHGENKCTISGIAWIFRPQGSPNTASQETIIRPPPMRVSGLDCRTPTASQTGQVVCLGRVFDQIAGSERRRRVVIRGGRRWWWARRREKRRMVRVRLRVTHCTTGSHRNQPKHVTSPNYHGRYLCQKLYLTSDLVSIVEDIMEAARYYFTGTLTS